MNKIPKYLGGHGNTTWIDKGAMFFMRSNYGIKSVLDIGCGPGGMEKVCEDLDIDWYGIDGDPSLSLAINKSKNFALWDYTKGSPKIKREFDLAWSIEFLEHVKEKYQDNYMNTFKLCKWAIITAAPPKWEGYHHVNCQTKAYWKNIFKRYGFEYREDVLNKIKKHSSMRAKSKNFNNKIVNGSFLQLNGMCFKRTLCENTI